MHVLVAHSRPKGKYGYYVFTAMIFFSKQTESAQIWATRLSTTYSCHHCGKWASIGTYEAPRLSDHRKIGTLELYRYDNVEPDDYIQLVLIDSELAYIQRTDFKIG